jgi:phytoene synthase
MLAEAAGCSHVLAMFFSPEAELVRRHDPDRYFVTLFAPEAHRHTLFTLYAFNHELARAREVASEPGLALIRLQWWREVVEGEVKAHEVAAPLHAALAEGRLYAPDLLDMIASRELEAETGIATISAWREWLLQGPGSLAVATGRVLGAPPAHFPRLRRLGAGYGASGVLRNAPYAARQGRCLMPEELLAKFNVTLEEAIDDPVGPKTAGARQALAFLGGALLGAPERCGKAWVAAALPAVMGRRDLARPTRSGPRFLGDRMAVTWAATKRSA